MVRGLVIERRPIIEMHPRKVAYLLAAIAIFLLVAHLIVLFVNYALGHENPYGLVRLFDLDAEQNAPTLFSTCLFLINAALFLSVWKAQRVTGKSQGIWLFLSGLFCLLAIDDLVGVHERIDQIVRSALNTTGLFYFAWIIPYGIAFVLLSIFVIPVWWRMESKVRFWLSLSAATYLAGAIGIEMIEGRHWEMIRPKKDLVYGLMVAIEESLEMVGLIMLVYALLSLIRSKYGGFLILVPDDHDASPPSNKSLPRTSENPGR